MPVPDTTKTGIVVIGRNEGARLVRCLDSLRTQAAHCVYVDSGSTDSSVQEARARGMEVVELDMSRPFTAARARNAGYQKLVASNSPFVYVQFVDGDCEVDPCWISAAQHFLDGRPDVGIVFGAQKERYPEQSIYNRVLNVEWEAPQGSVDSSGGRFMCRRELFERVGRFRDDLIAGEDPELCLRVRKAGALIWHLSVPMAIHEGDITRLSQWWKRTKRTGYAYAEGFAMHGRPPSNHYRRELRSLVIWALVIPLLILAAGIALSPWCLLGFLIYPLQVVRIARRGKHEPFTNWLYAMSVVVGKFPELHGSLRYHLDRIQHRQKRLIEYK